MRAIRGLLLLLPAVLTACASTTLPIPSDWRSVPRVTPVGAAELARFTGGTPPVIRPGSTAQITVVNGQLVNAGKPITERFAAIQSFDVSASRGEVIFSARKADKDDNFDIGLAATDGSKTNWLPAEPYDEVNVAWAPRGNKVSYTVRAKSGDIVRTLHIPTSMALSAEFPLSTVHALAWEPAAERYSVIVSSPARSPYVEVLAYSGDTRKTPVAPQVILDTEMEAFGTDAVVLRPVELSYNERLPVVVWRGEPHAWNDAVGALYRNARLAVIVVRNLDAATFQRIAATEWLDASRIFVVGGVREGAMSISGDPALAAGRYRVAGKVVSVAPDVVESFAADFIADRLKRNPPTNGSSR
jgi:hypothetical protein